MSKISNINSLLINIFEVALGLCAPFSKKIEKGVVGRRNSFEKLKSSFKKSDNIIHIHCASHGEYMMSERFTKLLKEKYNNFKFLLSFISPSGYDNVNKNMFDCVIYLPFESDKNCKKFYKIISPKITFFMKNEIWPNFISYAKINGSKVYSVGGNFRLNYLKKIFKINAALKEIDFIYVINEESRKIIKDIGNKNVIVCGDLRYDSLIPILDKNSEKIIKTFIDGKDCIVFGSTWKSDEKLIVKFINYRPNDIKYILAPHEVENSRRIKEKLGDKSILFSKIKTETNLKLFSCLIVDNIGMLSSLYNYSSIAYVGGGMGNKGLHNTLEPAYFSKPIIIGKNYKGFEEAEMMINNGNMISVSNYVEFKNSIERILMDNKLRQEMSEKCTKYYNEKKGAIEIVLKNLINKN